ncbi:AraC-type DNA-binding protein [Chitinophaga jiangningensis]|uniref:AraC-type DNA-binding protein n=1 Tax=Chitinophaga jiangningensis TaxID=1419482 RepID=A0A1M7M8G1_9BACT|nr:AraC family transcriptional regulator [Chitinophaga jiangningensis]SHM86974.1 AraC-type DNA-binding protein [Chitinophaga jiangningensis]
MRNIVSQPDQECSVISGEEFIREHTFFAIKRGTTKCFDGITTYIFNQGDCGLVRKNRLSKYCKGKGGPAVETTFITFDEQFLKKFQARYQPALFDLTSKDTFLHIPPSALLSNFVHSFAPYYKADRNIISSFADVKREELLLILLKFQPELSGLFFDFGMPEKLNLEAFMNQNFVFNVHMDHFARLTGRSLSAFKRDFKAIFNETPSRWLLKKRLQEAHFLIEKKRRKPADIYLELGFETLSHFSYAFKKYFGLAPTAISKAGQSTPKATLK